MAFNLVWDTDGTRFYESGVSNVVLYPYDTANETYGAGVAWNGCTSINDNPEGGDANDLWADNIKYGTLRSAEKVSGSIEAYTYPTEFEACDGMATPVAGMKLRQQSRKRFALCYRTEIGSDTDPDAGYKIHFLYGLTASPSDKTYDTINDSPDAITFSWDFESTPIPVTINDVVYKPTSSIEVDSRYVTEEHMTDLLEKAYGTAAVTGTNSAAAVPAALPTPSEIYTLLGGTNS